MHNYDNIVKNFVSKTNKKKVTQTTYQSISIQSRDTWSTWTKVGAQSVIHTLDAVPVFVHADCCLVQPLASSTFGHFTLFGRHNLLVNSTFCWTRPLVTTCWWTRPFPNSTVGQNDLFPALVHEVTYANTTTDDVYMFSSKLIRKMALRMNLIWEIIQEEHKI